ncbi:hypothetical protein ACWQV9_10075 [Brevundimonas diminuta]|uniref:hypothetical protein n=1 Tax=Brevundimonas diminuta TaxID=293 RepID=UPI003D9A5FD6
MIGSKTTNDLIRIAHAGGGFTLEAKLRSVEDLIRIAHAAGGRARLVFTGMAGRSTEDLIRIGHAGQGSVEFRD